MTQKDEITFYLIDNPNSTTKEVIEAFPKFPKPSVRRVLSVLRKENINIKANPRHLNRIKETIIEKARELIERKEPELRRKIVKATFIKSPSFSPYVITFEDNDTDRAKWLISKITNVEAKAKIEEISDNIIEGDRTFNFFTLKKATWGYDDQQFVDSSLFEYPEYEIGIE